MNPQELLRRRKNAKAAMEKTETAMEVATEALEKWKQDNPGFSLTNEWFLYYQKEVEIYKELISNKVGIDVQKTLDYESFMENEFPNFMLRYTINYKAEFKRTCLEMDLNERLTKAILVDDEPVPKVLLAVSGAGKTRRVYEEMFKTPGLYLTCNSQYQTGSKDLEKCLADTVDNYQREDYWMYLQLLICARLMIYTHLEELLTPPMLLLAQIHPTLVFGKDIFHDLYVHLCNMNFTSFFKPHAVLKRPKMVVIDNIQASMSGPALFGKSEYSDARTVFKPLWMQMDSAFGNRLVVAGTSIEFGALRDLMGASCFKESARNFSLVSDFSPMTKNEVLNYSSRVLLSAQKPNACETAALLSDNPLFVNGRPGFVAYVLDRLVIDDKALGDAVTMLENILSDPQHKYYPIRNWEEKCLQKCLQSWRGETYYTLVLDAVVSYLLGKAACIEVSDFDAADLINVGIGYLTSYRYRNYIVLLEPAIVEAILALFTPQEISDQFIKDSSNSLMDRSLFKDQFFLQMKSSLNCSMTGFHFEYLVLIKFYFDAKAQGQPFHIIRGSLDTAANQNDLVCMNDGYIVLLPDIYAGPDLVVAITKARKTVYNVIQCKFNKRLDTEMAISTTDYRRFYCNRTTAMPLRGYNGQHESCRKFFQGKTIERFIIHQGQGMVETDDSDLANVQMISKETVPDFFDSLGVVGIWDLEVQAQSSLSD
ncbi:hypothetical protein HDV02_001337 [Globomyces sp. JEL0801]|nr:hypothetical protein HDV02_001337 [Globomyces sp. JEL0801]